MMDRKRLLDSGLCLLLLPILSIPFCVVACLVKATSSGPVLYWSDRVGRNNQIFRMPKFRTMLVGTPAVATHLLDNPDAWLTLPGAFLRKFSLDEIPQVYSVLKGHISFVGPRPALFNQDDLVALRTAKGVQALMPGITGWAQINGRDSISIPEKVALDEYYLHNRSFALDVVILWRTALKVLKRHDVAH